MKKIFGISRDHFHKLLIFYLIAHGGIFFIFNAIYWDDWTLYNVENSIIIETFHDIYDEKI